MEDTVERLREEKQNTPNKLSWVIGAENWEMDPRYRPTGKLLGSGSFGFVCLAKDEKDAQKRKVAIKKIKDIFTITSVDVRQVLREVKLLKALRHPNIVKLIDVMQPKSLELFNELYIVMEFVPSDLKKIVRSDNDLTEEHISYIMFQILCGLYHMHSAKVIHRDLKPGNILVNSNCKVKICDLGMARGFQESKSTASSVCDDDEDCKAPHHDQLMTEYVVTRHYRAPEVAMGEGRYDESIDIWSAGCILAEIYNREMLFRGDCYIEQMQRIIEVLGSPSEEDIKECFSPSIRPLTRSSQQGFEVPSPREVLNQIGINVAPSKWEEVVPRASSEALDLLSKMLSFNPKKRITAEKALQHPYFAKFYTAKTLDRNKSAKEFDLQYEKLTRTSENVRELILREILDFHPELIKSRKMKGKGQGRKNSFLFTGRRVSVI